MSNDKNKSEKRRAQLLMKAVYIDSNSSISKIVPRERIMVNHEGGEAFDNPDLQRLIKDGMVKVPLGRGTPPKKFNSKFKKFFGWNNWIDWNNGYFKEKEIPHGSSIAGHAPRFVLIVTEKGKNWVKKFI